MMPFCNFIRQAVREIGQLFCIECGQQFMAASIRGEECVPCERHQDERS